MQKPFDAAATGPNGDFADHFTVPQATITDVRSGPHGQEVSTAVTVAVGSRKATRPLLFTGHRQRRRLVHLRRGPGRQHPRAGRHPLTAHRR